jgi:ribosomal protein S18 acetylase RimI-like enzyme
VLVGVAVAAPTLPGASAETLLGLGVAPAYRRRGLGRALLGRLVADRPPGLAMTATVNAAERDVVEPIDVALRIDIAGRLLRGAGFDLPPVSPDVRRDDPWAIEGRLPPG